LVSFRFLETEKVCNERPAKKKSKRQEIPKRDKTKRTKNNPRGTRMTKKRPARKHQRKGKVQQET